MEVFEIFNAVQSIVWHTYRVKWHDDMQKPPYYALHAKLAFLEHDGCHKFVFVITDFMHVWSRCAIVTLENERIASSIKLNNPTMILENTLGANNRVDMPTAYFSDDDLRLNCSFRVPDAFFVKPEYVCKLLGTTEDQREFLRSQWILPLMEITIERHFQLRSFGGESRCLPYVDGTTNRLMRVNNDGESGVVEDRDGSERVAANGYDDFVRDFAFENEFSVAYRNANKRLEKRKRTFCEGAAPMEITNEANGGGGVDYDDGAGVVEASNEEVAPPPPQPIYTLDDEYVETEQELKIRRETEERNAKLAAKKKKKNKKKIRI